MTAPRPESPRVSTSLRPSRRQRRRRLNAVLLAIIGALALVLIGRLIASAGSGGTTSHARAINYQVNNLRWRTNGSRSI
jgi:ferric-dicitrate binding protein FerR (iron transport regulator)